MKAFHLTDQVVDFFSLLLVIVFAIAIFFQRKRRGHIDIFWELYSLPFFAAEALAAAWLSGTGLANTDIFYAVRWMFNSCGVGIFLLSFLENRNVYPNDHSKQLKTATFTLIGSQIILNAVWVAAFLLYSASFQFPLFLDALRKFLMPFSMLWLAVITWRYPSAAGEDPEAARHRTRFSALFLVNALFTFLIVAHVWLPLSTVLQSSLSSYGWMMVFTGATVIYMGPQKHSDSLIERAALLISQALLLLLGLMVYLTSNSLVSASVARPDPQTLEQAMRPFVILQVVIVFIHFFILPRTLHMILPEDKKVEVQTSPALTPRQREVMRLLAAEQSNQQIALQMNITVRTAKHHVTTLMKTLEASSRYQLGEIARIWIEKNEL
jgi:DNA-binding CsgD family transcriptional regulator